MAAPSTPVAPRSRNPRGISIIRRSPAVSGAALVVGLLLGGCEAGPSAVAGPAAPPAPSTSKASALGHGGLEQGDKGGVAAVSAAWDAAWNAGDAGGIGATFTDDGEFINGRGQIASGASAIAAQHAVSLAGVFQGSHTEGQIRRITFLSGTTAVLDVDNALTNFRSLPPGVVPTAPGVLRQRHKRVLVKRGGTWRVLSMQLTSVAPAP